MSLLRALTTFAKRYPDKKVVGYWKEKGAFIFRVDSDPRLYENALYRVAGNTVEVVNPLYNSTIDGPMNTL